MGVPGIPNSVTWNGYKINQDNSKGDLVRVVLTPSEFIEFYMQGALMHKAVCMEIGGQKKAALLA